MAAAAMGGLVTSQVAGPTFDRLTQGVGRVIVASSEAEQKSYENDKIQNGYFTYNLVRALKQDGGSVPMEKVFAFVHEQVAQQVLADWKVHQTPVLSKSAQFTDIVIGVRPEPVAEQSSK